MSSAGPPTKRDVVLDAIAHRQTGRIPYSVLFEPAMGRALAAHYRVHSTDDIVDNSIQWVGNTLPLARLAALGLFRDGEFTDEWGVRWHGVGETRGQVRTAPLTEPTLADYRFPDQLPHETLDQMKVAAKAAPHRYRIAKLGALWEQATFLRGMDALLIDLLDQPAFVHDLLDGILEVLLANVQLYRAALPLDCMWLSDDYGGQSGLLMSPPLWRQFIRPRLARLCKAVHDAGLHFVLHSDGAIGPVIPDIVELGVDILHPVQAECVDVLHIKREFGQSLTLWGGYGTQGTLVFGTPEQVRREVHEACDVLGAGGGFILTPGLSMIQAGVPVENAAAFIEVAREREQGGS